MRFFIFGSSDRLTSRKVDAAYAFCLQDQPGVIYWARGTNRDAASIVRVAIRRILEAAHQCEPTPAVEIITSVTNLDSRIDAALNRRELRKMGDKSVKRHEEAEWVEFAQLFRASAARIGNANSYPRNPLFRAVKREAQRQRLRVDLPDIEDPHFSQRDEYDLYENLAAVVAQASQKA